MMGRFNKLTEGVFTDVVRTNSQISKVDVFLNCGDSIDSSKRLMSYTNKYRKYTTQFTLEMEYLAKIEKVILQLRALETMDNIKISILREYIYVRVPFYRTDKSAKDIRVLVGNTEFYEKDIENLFGSEEFMNKAKEKLTRAMESDIQDTIKEIKDLKEYITTKQNLVTKPQPKKNEKILTIPFRRNEH
jgi:hypothetical protein